MRLGHLVEDVDALARLRRIGDGKLDAAARILDVDESARLPAGSMHRQRIIERRLHDEAIEDGAVIAVIIETVDKPLIRSEEHTSDLQSLMRISYAAFCLKKKHT